MLIRISTTQINVGDVVSEHHFVLFLLLLVCGHLWLLQTVRLNFDYLNFVLVVGVLLPDIIVFSHLQGAIGVVPSPFAVRN